MNGLTRRNLAMYVALGAAMLLAITGALMLAQTFAYYNELSMQRQDERLQDMARAADESIAVQLNSIRADLAYTLERRGFVAAETQWAESGQTAEIVLRMQESPVIHNPLIHTLLAIRDGEVFLSANGNTAYTFMAGGNDMLQPCFAGDGTMYLALVENTAYAEYAALIDVAAWYADLARINASDQIRLMLLDGQETMLLHQWAGTTHVTAAQELNVTNCDIQAVRYMMTSRNPGQTIAATYDLVNPEDPCVHEMRMTIIPLEESVNGYFIVGLTSDYDEIIRPMQRAAIQLIAFGGMVALGVLLVVVVALGIARRGRRQDQELQRLRLKNVETQKLLEKTQELAHLQRLQTIGTLAASIAHEFNNLLAPIMGYSILTLERLPEDCGELADNVSEIYEASRKAQAIISRLSDLSRKNDEVTFGMLSLEDLVTKALQVAAPVQPPCVNTVICCDAPCRIEGDETQLSQMLLNLILNAFHAMQEKGGTLTLHIGREGDSAVLRVADVGEGIPAEVLPHIFDPFFTTKKAGRGTGLGLAIVQQVVENHHGGINVKSQPGEGTVFTVCFPLAVEDSIET